MSALKEKYINPQTDFDLKNYLKNFAEIAKFTKEEREAYEESLKYYRDINNVVDTSKQDAKIEIAIEMKKNGEVIDKIIKYTNLTKEEIEKL